MKVETKIQMEQRLKNDARHRIKDRINEKMELQKKSFQNKNKTRNENSIKSVHTTDHQKYSKFQHHVFNNNTKVNSHFTNTKVQHHVFNNNTKVNSHFTNTNTSHFTNTKVEELNNFENNSDYEAMWEIAIDKWTRNWNFYRERLTYSIL